MPVLDATVPYPWPYDACLDGTRLALVVAGAQKAWTARSVGVAEVRTALELVASAVRACGGSVFVVRHATPHADDVERVRCSLPPFVRDPTWELDVTSEPGDVIIDAAGVDGFCGSALDATLRARGIDHLVFGGFGYEAAVDSTLRSANDRGYECLVLCDAVAPFDEVLGAHALASTTMSGGIFGAIGSAAALVTALEMAGPKMASLEVENMEAVL